MDHLFREQPIYPNVTNFGHGQRMPEQLTPAWVWRGGSSFCPRFIQLKAMLSYMRVCGIRDADADV